MEDRRKRIYLDVPYSDKDDAKRLGAKWDAEKKRWYMPIGHKELYHAISLWCDDTQKAYNKIAKNCDEDTLLSLLEMLKRKTDGSGMDMCYGEDEVMGEDDKIVIDRVILLVNNLRNEVEQLKGMLSEALLENDSFER